MQRKEFSYDQDFEQTAATLYQQVLRWFHGPRKQPPQIEGFPEAVFFKSLSSTVVHTNQPYRDIFSEGKFATGRLATSFLDNSIVKISELTDSLILDGVTRIAFDHDYMGSDGYWFKMRSAKFSLLEFNDGAYEILGICRPILMERESDTPVVSLDCQYSVYKRLPLENQRLCLMMAEGRPTKEIALLLDVTSKTIENRRRQVIDAFGFKMKLDVVKMMVRFEERNFQL